MKYLVVILIIACASAKSLFDTKLDNEWEEYKNLFNKNYETKKEEGLRRLIWEINFKKIETHNKEANEGKHTFRQKMNQFGDLVSLFEFFI